MIYFSNRYRMMQSPSLGILLITETLEMTRPNRYLTRWYK